MPASIPSKIYKFQSFESEYSIENLKNSEVWFSKPKGLNDPFDCDILVNFMDTDNKEKMLEFFEKYYFKNLRKSGKEKVEVEEEISTFKRQHFPNGKPDQKASAVAKELFQEFSQKQKESYANMGVGCFTTELANILMWSHYANGHRGFCLEFDTELFLSSARIPDKNLMKVIYSDSYPMLSPTDWYESPRRLLEPLYTKSKDWISEQEWRLLKKNGNKGFRYNPNALTAIYFGCWATKENIAKITSLPMTPAPRFYKMQRSEKEFKLEYLPHHLS